MSKEIENKKIGRLYITSFKKKLVLEVEKEDGAITMIADRHGVNRNVLSHWLKQYGSEAYKSSKRKYRTALESHRIASEIVLGKLTIEEVQVKYNVPCRDTVTGWVKKYKRAQREFYSPSTGVPVIEHLSETCTQEHHDDSLSQAQLKIRALEIMLDIASAEFKVNIRKKYGAKQ